jgi:hypothetical protein
MKFSPKVNKHMRKFVLAGLALALNLATTCVQRTSPSKPSSYHLEASYEAKQGAKLLFDKH